MAVVRVPITMAGESVCLSAHPRPAAGSQTTTCARSPCSHGPPPLQPLPHPHPESSAHAGLARGQGLREAQAGGQPWALPGGGCGTPQAAGLQAPARMSLGHSSVISDLIFDIHPEALSPRAQGQNCQEEKGCSLEPREVWGH